MRLRGPVAIVLVLLALGISLNSFSLQQGMEHHHMAEMQAPAEMSPALAAKLEADKRFSEFNHRFAGLFVLFAGLLTLWEPLIAKRLAFVRYLWAAFFFIPGLYLFFLSDPESWPVGNQTLYHVITVNHQVLQHKIFSIILLVLGIVEFLRVHKQLRSLWAVGLFPALAAAGAVLLLFHPHPAPPGVPMDHAAHLAMQKIEHQHLGFAAVGFGIALSKAAVDLGRFNTRLMRSIFALLMVSLGILLLTYTE